MKDAKDYTYRNKTTEGKIESVKKTYEAIEASLKIREKMKEAGIDITEFDKKIQEGSVIIADNLNILLGNENKITINGELIESDDKTQKTLKGSNRYLLEGSKEIQENTQTENTD